MVAPLLALFFLSPALIAQSFAQSQVIDAAIDADDDIASRKIRVLIVAGLDGTDSAAIVRGELEWFRRAGPRRRFLVSAIPHAAAPGPFPPAGQAYAENAAAHALWRWILVHAPDRILEVGTTLLPGAAPVAAKPGFLRPALEDALRTPASEARMDMQRRLARSPREMAVQLSQVFGQDLPQPVYIPAMALVARLRLGHLDAVKAIAEPYASGATPSLAKATASHLSGHLLFAELARHTGDRRYVDLVVRAAAHDPLHNEMSDSVFMAGPIAAAAGRLTGETRYYEQALAHIRFMLGLNLRRDGLHRHSPLDESAWGRGNGFPALGLAWTLTETPPSFAGRAEVLAAFQKHMDALLPHQDREGMWHQVIDHPESYAEFTATAMIGMSMLRGIRKGWLARSRFQPAVDRAWKAILARTGLDGTLIDVCASTGKQRSLDDYLKRPAILGKDPRGGAMAMLFATEWLEK